MAEKGSPAPPGEKKEEESLPPIKEKWVPKNWSHFKKTEKEMRKMAPQLKSKMMAYEEPPKSVAEAQLESRKRLIALKKRKEKEESLLPEEDLTERDTHEKLIGQLKAAEARNRLRIMRLRYQANKAQEVNHLIACQPTALKAVRLQALVPPHPSFNNRGDPLDKLDRYRIERLIEDSQGLITNRT